MNPLQKGLTVTALDNPSGSVTAFFNELPGLVVQGSSISDVKTKLSSLLESYIKRLDAMKNNLDVQTKSLA